MANTKTKNANTEVACDITSENQVASEAIETSRAQAKPIVAKDIDPHQYVIVRNGFQGKLVYKSKRTGEHFVWDSFGSEQEMELKELRDAKNSCKKMFINNWFMFDEDWIIDYLGVRQFYSNIVRIEDFDKIFDNPPDKLKQIISQMSNGQRSSVSYRARQLISDGFIDSRKTISALEDALHVELIEQ